MHKTPTQKEAEPVLTGIVRDLLRRRSQILSKVGQLDGMARELAHDAADLYLADAETLRRCLGRLAK